MASDRGRVDGLLAFVALDTRGRWRRARLTTGALILVIGVIGGLVLAAATAAVRVADAFDRLVADIDAPELIMISDCVADAERCTEATRDPAPAGHPAVASVRRVVSVRPVVETLDGLDPNVRSDDPTGCGDQNRGVGLVPLADGGLADQALPFRLDGRLPDPGDRGVVLSRVAASRIGVSIGDTMLVRGWCVSEESQPALLDEPIAVTVTGLGVGPLDVESPGDPFTIEPLYAERVVFDALVAAGAVPNELLSVWLDREAAAEQVEAVASSPATFLDVRMRSRAVGDGLNADARLLWLLAAVVALVGALVVVPLVARHCRHCEADPTILAALGATPRQRAALGTAAAFGIAAAGAIVAIVVSALLARTLPTGLAASIEPMAALSFDPYVAVLGGSAIVIVVSSAEAIRHALMSTGRRTRSGGRSTISELLARVPLGAPEASGVRAGFGAAMGGRAALWTGVVSVALPVAAIVTSVTFVASLRQLEREPQLAGVVFDASVGAGDGVDVDELVTRLASRPEVRAATRGALFRPMLLLEPSTHTLVWPWIFDTGPGAIEPTITTGRAPAGPKEVALDVRIADELGIEVGDVFTLNRDHLAGVVADELGLEGVEGRTSLGEASFDLRVTGIAILPDFNDERFWMAALTVDGMARIAAPRPGEVDEVRSTLGSAAPAELLGDVEAALTVELAHDVFLDLRDEPTPEITAELEAIRGVEDVFVVPTDELLRVIAGASVEDADALPRTIAWVMFPIAILVLGYQVAVHLHLRNRELAILRSLGFTPRETTRSAVAHAVTEVTFALALGVISGIAIGKAAWQAYARNLHAVPSTATGTATLVLIVGTGWAAAALIAAFLGRPRRRRLAVLLRAE